MILGLNLKRSIPEKFTGARMMIQMWKALLYSNTKWYITITMERITNLPVIRHIIQSEAGQLQRVEDRFSHMTDNQLINRLRIEKLGEASILALYGLGWVGFGYSLSQALGGNGVNAVMENITYASLMINQLGGWGAFSLADKERSLLFQEASDRSLQVLTGGWSRFADRITLAVR